MAVLRSDRLEAAIKQLTAKIAQPAVLRVGWFPDDKYDDEKETPVAFVAALQEYGTGKIPSRSFFRKMIAEKQDSWPNQVIALLKIHNWDAMTTLNQLGEFVIKPQLQQSIISVNSPPLSPITIMLRYMKKQDQNLIVTGATVGEAARRVAAGEVPSGVSTKPLEDTKKMLNTVRSVVTST